MRAVAVLPRSGDLPRRPGVVDRPRPKAPRGTQVLVRVLASSVNGTDVALVRGGLPSVPGRRAALGFDVVGEVAACGPRVTSVAVGDRVVAMLDHGGGGQADEVLVPQDAVAIAPAVGPVEHAAALPLAGVTALQALCGRASLHRRPKARLLVIGAAGGIGSLAVQLGKAFGAHVTAVAGGDRGDFLRDLGAAEVVDGSDEALQPDRRWDVVLDSPSALRFDHVHPTLADDGVMVSTRPLSADVVRSAVSRPLRRDGGQFRSVAARPSGADLARLVRLVDDGRLRLPVDRVFPLDEVAEAHEHVGSGTVRGKVVLRV